MTDAAATRRSESNGVSQARRWVQEFAAGWRLPSSADSFADHFERLCAPDIRLLQPQLPPTVGLRAFREGFARPLFGLIPDLHATVDNWAAGDNVIYIAITFEGTLGGRPIRWSGIDRITLRDGLAVERHAVFDPLPLLRAALTRPRAWPAFIRFRRATRRARS